MIEKSKMGDQCIAAMVMNNVSSEDLAAPCFTFKFECFDAEGNLKWEDTIHNTVTTVGKTDLIDKYFRGSAYTASWFLGLKGAGTAVVGDTAASHASWSEVNPYTGNRPAITFGAAAAGVSVGAEISFTTTVAGPIAVTGAFITSVATGNGILYSAAEFTGGVTRTLYLNDVLKVTPTVQAS
jgi:hypothetical protein